MIDKLQRISRTIQILRLPAIAVGLICLATAILIILSNNSNDGDRFLIPSVVGVLWAMSTYTFIVTFRSVPEKADNSMSIFGKFRRHVQRGWYWAISVIFIGTTVTAIYFTNSMLSIWLRDYAE
jgi:hypothetical protein